MTANHQKRPKDLWASKASDTSSTLNDHFTDEVISRAHYQVIIGEFVFMFIRGFWSIISGFLKILAHGSRNANQQEVKKP